MQQQSGPFYGTPSVLQRDTSGGGNTVLVYGILGFILCQLLAPVAWVKGNEYYRTCAALGVKPSGEGVAGRVLGIVGTVIAALSVVCAVVSFVAH
jgi:hypothetical protein